MIPSSRINPVARSLLDNYYPLPNYNSDGTTNSNYRTLVPTSIYTNGYDIRIDHLLSSRQQIFGRWSWKDISTLGGNGLLPPTNQDMLNRNLILSHNYFIRPNLINEFRFGFSVFNGNNRFPIRVWMPWPHWEFKASI